MLQVKTIEIAGLHSVLNALHLPFGGKIQGESRSQSEVLPMDCGDFHSHFDLQTYGYVTKKDAKLISTLVKNGDEHAKVLRGLVVWAEVTAPRYWWQEADTYRIGVEKLASNSTMHQQGKGLSTDELVAMKDALPEGTKQTRVVMFSYQALRRIYFQRRNHRLPHWHIFCDWIKSLPYADEWITIERQ